MTSQLWNISIIAIQSIAEVPVWLKRKAHLNYEDVIRLRSVEATGEGIDALPSVEERLLRADYLDFLREQIQLEARGPEWGRILKKRLTDFEPFVGKRLIRVTFHTKPHLAILEIDPEALAVIHMEVH